MPGYESYGVVQSPAQIQKHLLDDGAYKQLSSQVKKWLDTLKNFV